MERAIAQPWWAARSAGARSEPARSWAGLTGRTGLFLALVALWSALNLVAALRSAVGLDLFFHLHLARHPAAWLPIPLLPAALAFIAARRVSASEPWAWAVAGWLFGALVYLTWGPHPLGELLRLLAIPLMVGGASPGERVHVVLDRPGGVGREAAGAARRDAAIPHGHPRPLHAQDHAVARALCVLTIAFRVSRRYQLPMGLCLHCPSFEEWAHGWNESPIDRRGKPH